MQSLHQGGVQESGQGHRKFHEEVEEAGGVRMPRKGEVPPRVEEQDGIAEAVHDESSQAGQDDIRHDVSNTDDIISNIS